VDIEVIEPESAAICTAAEKKGVFGWQIELTISVAAFGCVLIMMTKMPATSFGDGPVHVYYASVMRWILLGDPWYARVYAIRHIVQPYSLHYLIIESLLGIAQSDGAEKVMVLLAVISCWTGLARAIRAFRPCTHILYPWVLPLILTWSLAGGFYNFCFASGVLFHAIAEWTGLRKTGKLRHLAGLILLIVLLAFAHPLPLLVLAAYVGLETMLVRWMSKPHSPRMSVAAALFVLAGLAAPAMLYDHNRIVTEMHFGFHQLAAQFVLTGACVDFFIFKGYRIIYRLLLIGFPVIAIFSLSSGIIDRLRWRRLEQRDVLLLIACVLLVAAPFLPSTLNGALYGERRLAALAWPVLCIGLASRPMKENKLVQLLGVIGCGMTIAAVVSLGMSLAPTSELMQEMEQAPLPAFRTGLFLETDAGLRNTEGSGNAIAYWAGVRGFVPKHDLLLNSPWLSETHIPLQEKPGAIFLNDLVRQEEINTPVRLYNSLLCSHSLRAEVSRRIDFAVIVDPSDHPINQLSAALDSSYLWDCQAKRGAYAICVKRMR
jgi:hypothetical protein